MRGGPGMLAETGPAGISSPKPHGIILYAAGTMILSVSLVFWSGNLH